MVRVGVGMSFVHETRGFSIRLRVLRVYYGVVRACNFTRPDVAPRTRRRRND